MSALRPICACRLDRFHKTGGDDNARRSICENNTDAASPAASLPEKRLAHRSSRAAGWALPSLGLALVPKCPMCIATWLALGGTFGISFTAAAYLRTGFVWLCWGLLALIAVRLLVRFSSRTRGILSGK